MKTTRSSRGFISIGLAIFLVIAALVALAGAYTVHQKIETDAALSATTTVPIATTSWPTPGTSTPPTPHPLPWQPAPITATSTSGMTITGSDTGKTIYLHPGDRFVLDLGTGLKWSNIIVADTDIIGPAETFAAEKNGVFQALAKGTTTLTASGAPICPAMTPCPQFMLRFYVTIVVN